MTPAPIIFLTTCIVSLGLTGIIRDLGPWFGLTDKPDGHRKLHERATPVGGGLAIYLTMVCVLCVLWFVPNSLRTQLHDQCQHLPALLLAGGIIVAVGLIDDIYGIPGRLKLLGQVIAASTLLADGIVIHQLCIFGTTFTLGWFAVPFTLFWLLGAVNALNLLDGIDGLATVVGIILSVAIAAMAVLSGNTMIGIVAMIFAGSLLGFLRFNFPPATIFLGDTGSMLIGLMVGVFAILGSLKGPGTVLLAAPLAIWMLPIFDVTAAILRRKLTGRSIYATDRGHLHHLLLSRLGSNHKVLFWIALTCSVTSIAALISAFQHNDMIAMITCSAVAIIFIATGVFGRVELALVGSRLSRIGQSLAFRKRGARTTAVRLQGSRRWELLWETFLESADKLSLNEIRLDVSIPFLQEGYHALWERPRQEDRDKCWRVELPLATADQPVGRLVIGGVCGSESSCVDIQQLLDLVEPFESQLRALSEQKKESATTKIKQQELHQSDNTVMHQNSATDANSQNS